MSDAVLSALNFTVRASTEDAEVSVDALPNEGDVLYYKFRLRYAEPTVPQTVSVACTVPVIQMWSVFSSSDIYRRNIGATWNRRRTSSRLASGAPLCQIVSPESRSRLTVALSDAANPTEIALGVREHTAEIDCEIRFFTQPVNRITEYEAVIRMDFTDCRYEDALRAAEQWWAEDCGYPSAYIPEIARRPLYSTWYSFHQDIDVDAIVRQCALAREYGMQSVIVDDGWQNAADQYGYPNCGDWIPSPDKVPDMREFVRRIHDLGMKFTLWFHVPAMGVASKAHRRFETMLLNPSARDWAAYDPRFPETRRYFRDILCNAVRDWDLDGVKLDFIDSFKLAPETPAFDERWDTLSLEEGVERLLSDITSELRAVKPDIIIEFRQSYFGPLIRKYGNMIRVGDCPNDSICNHIAGIDLRLMLGKTAVHSDMLMWHPQDTVQMAARQVISTLFLVPQISVLLDRIPEEHRRMLRFYLDFWNRHRDTLLDGTLTAENPEAGYSQVCAASEKEKICVAYALPVTELQDDRTLYFINSGSSDFLYVRTEHTLGTKAVCIYTPTGETVSETTETIREGIREYRVPVGGMLVIG